MLSADYCTSYSAQLFFAAEVSSPRLATVFQNHVPTKKMPTIQSLWREQKLKDLLQIDLKTTSAD